MGFIGCQLWHQGESMQIWLRTTAITNNGFLCYCMCCKSPICSGDMGISPGFTVCMQCFPDITSCCNAEVKENNKFSFLARREWKWCCKLQQRSCTSHKYCPSLGDADLRGHEDQNEPAQHLNDWCVMLLINLMSDISPKVPGKLPSNNWQSANTRNWGTFSDTW